MITFLTMIFLACCGVKNLPLPPGTSGGIKTVKKDLKKTSSTTQKRTNPKSKKK